MATVAGVDMLDAMSDSPFDAEHFERVDASPDPEFYVQPRLLAHIDETAIAAVRQVYAELLPKRAAILDLMSSYLSHMPSELEWTRLCGLGLNEVELRENAQLTDYVVHDLNAEAQLPFGDGEFDAAVVTVSVQYMTQPVETFREVARTLRPGAPFVLTYSNRMFATKAVRVWRELNDRDHANLIGAYFRYAGGFGAPQAADRTLPGAGYHDPLFAVWAHRAEDARD
jgi:SAM-dependent methyltransferase